MLDHNKGERTGPTDADRSWLMTWVYIFTSGVGWWLYLAGYSRDWFFLSLVVAVTVLTPVAALGAWKQRRKESATDGESSDVHA